MLYRVENKFSGFLLGLYDEVSKWRALAAYARDCGFASFEEACAAIQAEPGEIIVTPVVGDWSDRRWQSLQNTMRT
jgi:hypothetical protein